MNPLLPQPMVQEAPFALRKGRDFTRLVSARDQTLIVFQ